eukprot:439114_1
MFEFVSYTLHNTLLFTSYKCDSKIGIATPHGDLIPVCGNQLVNGGKNLDAASCVSTVCGLYDVEFYDEATYTNYCSCSGSINDHSDNVYAIVITQDETVLNGFGFKQIAY